MPIGLAGTSELKILLSLKDKASAKLKTFSKDFKGVASGIAKGAAIAGAAMAVGIGIKAVKSAADFEKAMANVATLVDTNTESMTEMGRKVKEISKKIPVDISELTTALYDVRSAGISAADAIGVLETSGRLAVAGLATTQEATNLLTSAINVYGDETHNAEQIADILFSTVKAGKTTVAELSQGFGKVAAIAKTTGISLEDLSAATAILTTGGIKAAEAQTSLKAMISNILKPTKDATDAAEKLGIQFDLGALQAKGLSGMLKEIAMSAGDDKQALADLFGSVEAANAIFALTSEEGGAALDKLLNDMATSSGVLTTAFNKQTQTAAAQYQLLKNQLNVALMDLGNILLPKVISGVKILTETIAAAKWFWDEWIDMLSRMIDKIDTAVTKMQKFFGLQQKGILRSDIGETISVMKLPGFQHGGVVPGAIGAPMPALVHGGETIIPAGRGIGGITINITGNTFMADQEGAEAIGDLIIERLKTQMRFMT